MRVLCLLTLVTLIGSCTSKIEVKGSQDSSGASEEYIPPYVEDITYENGQLKITGKSLHSLKSLKLTGKKLRV